MKRLFPADATVQSPIDHEILLVDDEVNVLSVLQRIFENQYVVHTANSGEEALRIFRTHHPRIALILSDQRMPNMQGTEFLSRTMEIKPDCIRMILTGYTDVKDLIDSINSGRVFQYITKPFETDDLVLTVRRGVDYYVQRKELERAHADLQQAFDQLQSAQERLMQSEKLSMLGQLMGNIAHEIRNPITNIANSARLLHMDWETIRDFLMAMENDRNRNLSLDEFLRAHGDTREIQKELESSIQIIENSCGLVTEIVEDLRGFSRLDNAEFVRFDLHQSIDRALVLLKTKFKHIVNFHKNYAEVPSIEGLPGPVAQVMINMINNAAQAVAGQGGDVWISTKESQGTVVVSVRDNGPGIEPAVREKIFHTGFTTKTDTEGTGLGLAIVQEIMRRHGGHVELRDSDHSGAEFLLHFPISQNGVVAEKEEG